MRMISNFLIFIMEIHQEWMHIMLQHLPLSEQIL